jgi:hypothetical protein
MAGIALTQRDLAATRTRLQAWFEHGFTGATVVSELRAANKRRGLVEREPRSPPRSAGTQSST